MSDNAVTESSGNIFADLGFEDPEEELLKAKLSRQLRVILKDKGLSANEAAIIVGIEAEEIAAIVVGDTESISIEQLVRCLDRLDYTVDVVFRPKSARPSDAAAA